MNKMLTLMGRRYRILEALYPDTPSSLGELAGITEHDKGNLSRYITELEEQEIITTYTEPAERGIDQRISTLTETTKQIMKTMKKQEKKTSTPIMDKYLETLLSMIDPRNREQASLAADELEYQTRQNPVETPSKTILSILDKIGECENYNLLKTLNNIIDDLDHKTRTHIKIKTLNTVNTLPNNDQRITKQKNILNQKLSPSRDYEELLETYREAIKVNPLEARLIRDTILDKHPERLTETRLMLIKNTAGEHGEKYAKELSQLPRK